MLLFPDVYKTVDLDNIQPDFHPQLPFYFPARFS